MTSKKIQQLGKERIEILINLAKSTYKTNPQLAKRYVALARKIAMAARVRLPSQYKRQICKVCNSLLVPGLNCRVRLKPKRQPRVVVTCLSCGSLARYPITQKKESLEFEQNNLQNETSCST